MLAAVALAATACGSGNSTARSTGEHRKFVVPTFDPAHHYSVTDVERAFAAHGIRFTALPRRMPDSHTGSLNAIERRIRRELTLRNVVGLRAGRRPHAVFADVMTGSRSNWFSFIAGAPPSGEHFITRRNVIVGFDSGHRAAVRAALAQLH